MQKSKMALLMLLLIFCAPLMLLAANAPSPAVSMAALKASHRDVPFVPGSTNPLHKLDIYTPTNGKPASGYPLLVYVHGGGFARGDKDGVGGDSLLAALKGLDNGYMVASVNYRLSGTDKAPAQIVDVKAAVRFLKASAARYGFNPEKIVLMGVSAGASLAATAATSADTTAFDAELEAIGAVKGNDRVAAVISFYGTYDFNTLTAQYNWLVNAADTSLDSKYLPTYASARKFFLGKKATTYDTPQDSQYQVLGGPVATKQQLITKVNAGTYISQEPPFLIRHGSADENIPFMQSVDFAAALRSKGNIVDFALVEGAEHGLDGKNFYKLYNDQEIFDWLKKIIR
jgi:acetyl esterase/lipase